MREIKFRAWDKAMNWMVYDVQNAYDGMWSDKNTDEINDHYNYVSTMQSFMNEKEFGFMQYTGLKGKNGEIYEGDIVKWGHLNQWSREQPHRIAEVKFDPDIQFHSQVGVFNFGSFAYRDTTETDLEVIGNIYENPELIKNET